MAIDDITFSYPLVSDLTEINGGPTATQNGTGTVQFVAASWANALDLTAETFGVDANVGGLAFTGGYTLMCWLDGTDTDGGNLIESSSGSGPYLAWNGTTLFGGHHDGTAFRDTTTTGIMNGAPRHVAVTWNPADDIIRLYVDGVEVDSETLVTAAPPAMNVLRMGHNSSSVIDTGDVPNCLYGQVRIYQRALSATEIVTARDTLVGSETTVARKTIFVPLHGWSGAQVADVQHPGGPWITDTSGGEIVYEAHHYWDRDNSGDYPDGYSAENSDAISRGYTAGTNTDALHTRIRTELAVFTTWLGTAKGFLGEFGWPWDVDVSSWNALGDVWLTDAITTNLWGVTQWAAGEWWGAYSLGIYVDTNLATVRPNSEPIETVTGAVDSPLQPRTLEVSVNISRSTVITYDPGTVLPKSLSVSSVISKPTIFGSGEPTAPTQTKAVTDALRRALVHSIDLDYDYSVYVLDDEGNPAIDITDRVFSCKILHENFKTVHGSIIFETSSTFRYARDQIKVVLNIRSKILGLFDEIPLGVYIPVWPDSTRRNLREIVGYDKMWLLDHPLANNISIVKDETILSVVKNILAERTIYEDAIDPSRGADVSTNIRTWNADDEGNRYSTVVNELLSMVGYGGMFMTANGLPRSFPYTPPENQPLSWLYSAGEVDNIIDASNEGAFGGNQADIPNRWRFYRNDNDQRDVIPVEGDGYFFFDNVSEGSNSQEALGVVIPKTVGIDAISQETLETSGLRIVAEDLRANENASFTTFMNPYHWHFDVLNLQEHLLGAVGRFQHISWEMDLDNGIITHEVRRVQGAIT